MALTTADLDALDKAIASGAMTVRYADRTVEFDSFEQLLARRAWVARQLSPSRAQNVRVLQFTRRSKPQ